jgi:hypothetical protein
MNRNLNISSKPSFLPLRDAVLCKECEFVSADSGDACQVCGGRSLVRLSDLVKSQVPQTAINARDMFHFFGLHLNSEPS